MAASSDNDALHESGSGATSNVGWHSDPTHRFELRYHNGRTWTADVSSNGERFVDPAGARPSIPSSADAGSSVAETRLDGQQPSSSNVAQRANPVATASMVLGIIAIGIGWMPVIVVLGAIAAILAVAFGAVGRRRARDSGVGGGFAIAGLVLGAIGVLVCIGGVIFSVALFGAIDRFENPGPNTTSITSCDTDDNDVTATGSITNTGESAEEFTVRVHFVRPGTNNEQRAETITIDELQPGASEEFSVSVRVADADLECTVGAVRGPLPYGIDPGT